MAGLLRHKVDGTVQRVQLREPLARLSAYLSENEAALPGLQGFAHKEIIWADGPQQTDWAVVYFHGYSATKEEIRPVPDKVAEALGANLYFYRLTGHGQDGDALAAAEPEQWIADMAEAIAIGERIGKRLLIVSTSTGGTLAIKAALTPALSENIAGMVLVAPHLGLADWRAQMIFNLPLAKFIAPALAGQERHWETPDKPDAMKYATNRYPTRALVPLADLVRHVTALDFSQGRVPLLHLFANEDQTVSTPTARRFLEKWGGPVTSLRYEMTEADDQSAHVITGNLNSPNQTERSIADILDFVVTL